MIATMALLVAAQFAVRVDNGVPRIVRDGTPVVPRLFECNPSNAQHWWKHVLSDGAIRREYGYAREQGVELVSLSGFELLWPGDEAEALKRNMALYVETLLAIHPQAFVIPRLLLRPSNSWLKRHPEARTTFSDGSRGALPSCEAPAYRRDLVRALTDTIRFLEGKYGGHLAGYQIGGGQWQEWFYEGFGTEQTLWPGYDDATKRAFGSEPPTAEQMGVRNRALHAPAECPREIAYIDFLNASMTDLQLAAAHAVRQVAGKGRLVFSFSCYLTTCCCDYNAGGCGRSGHLALRRVMDSPDIDVITSPIGYHDRAPGGVPYAQACAESILRRGKVYLCEDDSPTHLATLHPAKMPPLGNAQGWKAKDAEETLLMLRRNLAACSAANYPLWWMDLHGSGWFDDPVLWPEMARFRPVERALMERPRPFEPEIALAMDDLSRKFVFGRGTGYRILFESNIRMASQLGHTGAPYGHYLADDLLEGRFPRVKFAVFSDLYALDAARRERVRDYARSHACAFLAAPGYIDLETGRFSAEAVRKTTGFAVEELTGIGYGYVCDPKALAEIGVPPIDAVCGQNDKADFAFPETVYLAPQPEAGDLVLGRFANGGKPALVLRRNGHTPRLFCGGIKIPIAILTAVAKMAGVRLYASCGNIAMANGDFLAITAGRDGPMEVFPPTPGRYRDLLTGRTLGEGAHFTITLRKGETIIPALAP